MAAPFTSDLPGATNAEREYVEKALHAAFATLSVRQRNVLRSITSRRSASTRSEDLPRASCHGPRDG